MTPPQRLADEQASSLHAAWQELLAKAQGQPWLLAALCRHGTELSARFLAIWERLRRRPKLASRVQRRLGLTLAGTALLLALSAASASNLASLGLPGSAIVANETTCSLALPGAAGSVIVANQTTCTLAQAITAANSDTAVGGCTAGSGADTIDLQADVTLTAVDNSTYGPSGLPVITSPITIAGSGHTIRRAEAAPEFRILAVGVCGRFALDSATVSGGVGLRPIGPFDGGGGGIYNRGATFVNNSTLSGNHSPVLRGGGINSWYARLEVRNSTIAGNSAGRGAGISVSGEFQHEYPSPEVELTVVDSTVSGNTDADRGGGIYVWGAEAIIAGSTVRDNRLAGSTSGYIGASGGGIAVSAALATITDSRITGNTAPHYGGGLANYGHMTIMRSTVSGNSSGLGEGGVYALGFTYISGSTISGNSASKNGGGIYLLDNAVLRLEESVITGNTAGHNGGGISAPISNRDVTPLAVLNSTVSGNNAGYQGGGIYIRSACYDPYLCATVGNSIVSVNVAEEGGGIFVHPLAACRKSRDKWAESH